MRRLVAAVLVAMVLAACGDDDDEGAPVTEPEGTTTMTVLSEPSSGLLRTTS